MSQPRDDRQEDLFRPPLEEIIKLAAPDLWNRIGRGCELHLHLTADNIRQGECDATIWHVNHLNNRSST